MKKTGGQVTIFISLVMMCVFALFFALLESARTAGARWYLQTAASSALDSVFSQYHRQLWDSYRLLFAEYENGKELAADFLMYMQPYRDNCGWYPLELQDIETELLLTATDGHGSYFEQEILDYMAFGLWEMDFNENSIEELWDNTKEAGAVQEVAETYRGHAKKALELERSLEAISKSQDLQQGKKQEGISSLKNYDGPGFRRIAKELIQELKRMPGLIANYQKQADKLASELKTSRLKFEEKKSDCSSQVENQIDNEIRQFESYIDQDGQRRKEIEALEAKSYEQITLIENIIEEAEEVEEIIDNWESDDEDDEGPDLSALWAPVIRRFNQLAINPLSFSHGVKDKEKEGWLNQITQLYQSGFLALVLPPGTEVSTGLLDTPELPSQNTILTEKGKITPLFGRLLINEYCGRFFCTFPADTEKKQNAAIAGDGGLSYELEYLIGGNDTDEGNLTSTITQLLAIREGLNLIHILSDSKKRHAAEELAAVITGIAGLSPLVLLTTFFIMSIWALGESLMDIRNLLAGKRVMIIKAAEDWSLGLDGLLALGQTGDMDTKGGGRGLTYLSWLKILLLLNDILHQEYRMMDIIQMNICRKQPSFRLRRGVYQVRLLSRFQGKHLFFSLGYMDAFTGNDSNLYPMNIRSERTY